MSSLAASRPVVSVYSSESNAVVKQVALPAIFTAPIRPDVVNFVHTNMNKNNIQAHGVSRKAGHQTSAESWGTGRAVARIPRVGGGGTQRSGQGAFGNMCRSGRMFSPIRIWRKWHRKINVNQRRFAVASAVAASAVPALVMARGHRIENLSELPLVFDASSTAVTKTAQAMAVCDTLGLTADIQKCKDSKKLRCGVGKSRNRRYVMRKGPLLVHHTEDNDVVKAFRNIPGVDTCHVDRLNVLQLAPGGHVGRLIIWTTGAFTALDTLYGTYSKPSAKKNYTLPRHAMSNANLGRLINSDEIQSVVRPTERQVSRRSHKKNPLKNLGMMVKLNPYALVARRAELRAQAKKSEKKRKAVSTKTCAKRREQSKALFVKNAQD
jgi:large subunit ribosomal protein L4e